MDTKTLQGEVMRAGEKFTYLLVVTDGEYRARVFRTDGALSGWIACGVFPPFLAEAENEAAARTWVERCIVWRVGLR